MKFTALIIALGFYSVACSQAFATAPADMALIEGGTYIPLFGDRNQPRSVATYYLDRHQVTNAQFLDFVRSHPAWQRSKVSKLFADLTYLSHWAGDLELGPQALPDAPVVNVSWFAVRAYLKSVGKRLPSEDEWEYAARADATRPDATKDPKFLAQILTWYAQPAPAILASVKNAAPDCHGIAGLHGLVWEWVDDFNNQIITGSSRGDSGLDRTLSCAAGVASATDATDYAAFMRYAMRSSLEAHFTTRQLGFRGARDAQPTPSMKP